MEMERREHYERGLADGITQGRQEGELAGEKRGKREAKREIILHMLSQNQTPEAISELTGEPLAYIGSLNSSDK